MLPSYLLIAYLKRILKQRKKLILFNNIYEKALKLKTTDSFIVWYGTCNFQYMYIFLYLAKIIIVTVVTLKRL